MHLLLATADDEYLYSTIVPVFILGFIGTMVFLLKDGRRPAVVPFMALGLIFVPLAIIAATAAMPILWIPLALWAIWWATKPARAVLRRRGEEAQQVLTEFNAWRAEHPIGQPQYMVNAGWKPARLLPPPTAEQRAFYRRK